MTKKNLAALSLILLATLGASAQTPAEWVKFSPPGGLFNVLMPAEPKEEMKRAGRNANGPFTVNMFAHVSPAREVYMVGWADYEREFDLDVEAELAVNRDAFLKSFDAKLLSTTPIKLGAHPGIEFKAEATGKADIVLRLYVVGRRPHFLVAVAPPGRGSSADRERFFSSFRLGAAR